MPIGKKAAKIAGQPMLVNHLFSTAMAFPANYDAVGAKGVDWGMMLNDSLGDCTIAGVGHKMQADTAFARVMWTANDNLILGEYEAWDGYRPGDPASDQGGVEADVLRKWFKYGFYGHHLVAYGLLDHSNHDAVRHFCSELNGLYIGVQLPLTAQSQAVWDVTAATLVGNAAPGSWGGHCVYVYGYTSDSQGNLKTIKFISWGKQMEMTVEFWDAYVDESWGLLTAALIKNGKTPANLNVASLQAEIEKLPEAA
jgi:hypothetical protein